MFSSAGLGISSLVGEGFLEVSASAFSSSELGASVFRRALSDSTEVEMGAGLLRRDRTLIEDIEGKKLGEERGRLEGGDDG